MNLERTVIEWSKNEILGIEEIGLEKIWTEIDNCGHVTREIGFDRKGGAIHFGSIGIKGNFLFDGQEVKLKRQDASTRDIALVKRFEEVWAECFKNET